MSTGMHEDNSTSWLIYGTPYFQRVSGFSSMADAISSLALELYHKFEHELPKRPLDFKCCQTSKSRSFKFCSECGRQLNGSKFDADEFKQFIVDLHDTTCDTYEEAEQFGEHEAIWWPWCFQELIKAKKSEIVWIPEAAEQVLLAALYDLKPELQTDTYSLRIGVPEMWSSFKKGVQPDYE